MSVKLPILNSLQPCLVDHHHAKWFQSKVLSLDDIGVWYTVHFRRYYVRDQVMALAVQEGRKCYPPGGRAAYTRFVRSQCDPEVQRYCLQSEATI